MNINPSFCEITENTSMNINGGDWIGGDLINAIFDCGRKMGSAIGNILWG